MHNRIQKAVSVAQQAFWVAIAEQFPEITTGDFPPGAQVAFDGACVTAATCWVEGNLESALPADEGRVPYQRSMASELPSFPPLEETVVDLLNQYGFSVDLSWRNDSCPSFGTGDDRWQMWIDHPQIGERELVRERFALYELDEEKALIEVDGRPALMAETVEELAVKLAEWHLSLIPGSGNESKADQAPD